MSIEDGGPAFPIRDLNEHPGPIGMTLRDHFAGLALSMQNCNLPWDICADMTGFDDYCKNCAKTCYGIADAMIKERNK